MLSTLKCRRKYQNSSELDKTANKIEMIYQIKQGFVWINVDQLIISQLVRGQSHDPVLDLSIGEE